MNTYYNNIAKIHFIYSKTSNCIFISKGRMSCPYLPFLVTSAFLRNFYNNEIFITVFKKYYTA